MNKLYEDVTDEENNKYKSKNDENDSNPKKISEDKNAKNDRMIAQILKKIYAQFSQIQYSS